MRYERRNVARKCIRTMFVCLVLDSMIFFSWIFKCVDTLIPRDKTSALPINYVILNDLLLSLLLLSCFIIILCGEYH